MASLKGDIWTNWLGGNKTLRAAASNTTYFQTQLQENYGSGFEIEAYVYPHKYPSESTDDSIWLDDVDLAKYQFEPAHLSSINFSTDGRSASDWFQTHKSKLTVCIRDFVAAAIQAQVVGGDTSKCSGPDTKYTFDKSQGWVYRKPFLNKRLTFDVTLATGVMLPNVGLAGAAQGGNTASEFSSYLNKGYDTAGVSFWHLGKVVIYMQKAEKNGEYYVKVDVSRIAGPVVARGLERQFRNEGLFIRGNDGQFAASLDTVRRLSE